jgi:hypothetical protein
MEFRQMKSIEADLERLNLLLDDLRSRALWTGQTPYKGMQDLGTFVEEVNKALALVLDFPVSSVNVNEWHNRLKEKGYPCPSSWYGPLHHIYGYRNIASHSEEEKHRISYQYVEQEYAQIRRLVPDLVERLTRHDLVSSLFAVQAASWPQLRAKRLRAAIAESGADIEEVLEYALRFIPPSRHGIRKAPREKRLELCIPFLAAVNSPPHDDLLKCLVDHLLTPASGIGEHQPLRAWLRQYGSREPPGMQRARIRVIRLSIERDPARSEGLLVRDVAVVVPPVPQVASALSDLPIEVPTPDRFPESVASLLNRIGSIIRQVLGSFGEVPRWSDFVLELEVPYDLACIDFEALESRPGWALKNTFRCVTIRPFDDIDALTPLRGIVAPLAHPRYGRNAVALWGSSDVGALLCAGQEKDCLFTGPSAWRCDGVPPLVEAFVGFPGAIVCSEDNEPALDPIYQSEDERQWPEILDSVTRLRRSGARLKVLWNDPDNAPHLAQPL